MFIARSTRQAATVDRISAGRVEVAIGAGYFERELESIGIPFLTPRGRANRATNRPTPTPQIPSWTFTPASYRRSPRVRCR